MSSIFRSLRNPDIQKLADLIHSSTGEWSSWIIQGMPNSGVEEVYSGLKEYLSGTIDEHWLSIEIDFTNFWKDGILQCVNQILSCFGRGPADSLPNGLKLIEENIGGLTMKEQYTVFWFSHFDVLRKFKDMDEVQSFLNLFQSLCSSARYKAVNIIYCYKDVEDICQATNYSDYYKIFGSNHFRVRPVAEQVLKTAILNYDSSLSPSNLQTILTLSNLYPEHAEVLMRYADEEISNIEKNLPEAIDLIFTAWEDCLTADEKTVVYLIALGADLGPDHAFSKRKLIRKGIVSEREGKLTLSSHLFFIYLSDRQGKKDSSQLTYIRQAGKLDPTHRKLIQDLFHGHYYLEFKIFQAPTPENATVYLITGEDHAGIPYRPCFVKIDSKDRSEKEREKLAEARRLLGGSLVPGIICISKTGGLEAAALEYATSDNKDYISQQFGGFYQEHSPKEIEEVISNVMGKAFHAFYINQEIKPRKAVKLYYLPVFDRGEFQEISRLVKKSKFYDPDADSLRIPGVANVLPNIGTTLSPNYTDENSINKLLFETNFPTGLCMTHGDLNPRNLLIDGINQVHLIDFTEMRTSSARFRDFTRLEAEIKFKLHELTPNTLLNSISLEILLARSISDYELECLKKLPLENEYKKMLMAVITLRQVSRKICTEKITDEDFDREYKLGLLSQTLRISLFRDYISEQQQELAVISASLLVNHLTTQIKPYGSTDRR